MARKVGEARLAHAEPRVSVFGAPEARLRLRDSPPIRGEPTLELTVASLRTATLVYQWCTGRPDLLPTSFSTFAFHLQNSMFREWSRGDSNPRPPPCKGATGFPGASWRVRVCGLYTAISVDRGLTDSGCVRLRPTGVAARLLRTLCSRYLGCGHLRSFGHRFYLGVSRTRL